MNRRSTNLSLIFFMLLALSVARAQDSGVQLDSRPSEEPESQDPWLFRAIDRGSSAARPFVDSTAYKGMKKAYETNLRSTQTQYYQPKVNTWKDTLTGGSPGGASKTPLDRDTLRRGWTEQGRPGNYQDWKDNRQAMADEAKRKGDLLKKGSTAIDVAGPVATFFGTLAGGGSLVEAGAGALNDFGKFWTKKAAGGLGGAGGFSVAGPAGGAVGSVVASEGAGKAWDATAGKKTSSFQQQMANVDGTFRNIAPGKWDHYLALQAYGKDGPPEPKPVGTPGTATTAVTPGSAASAPPGAVAVAPKPVGLPEPGKGEKDDGSFGPRPADWPADEPWPPTPERLLALFKKENKTPVDAEPSPTPAPTPVATPVTKPDEPTPTPEPESTPGPGGSADDFANGDNAGDEPGTGDGDDDSSGPGKKPREDFDTSSFAAGQARDDGEDKLRIAADYAQASALESELRDAEEDLRRTTKEALRVAAKKRGAHERGIQMKENMLAQKRAYDAYKRWAAKKKAYNDLLARRKAQARRQVSRPRRHPPVQQPQPLQVPAAPAHQSGGLIQDPPQ